MENQENMDVEDEALERKAQQKREYLRLLDKVEDICDAEQVGVQAMSNLQSILEDVNKLSREYPMEQQVKDSELLFMDTLIVSSTSSAVKNCIDSINVLNSTYNPEEFAEKLIESLHIEEDFQPEHLWNKSLWNTTQKLIPAVPTYFNLFGSFDIEAIPVPTQKKPREKRTLTQQQRKEPEKLTQVEKVEEGIEKIVKSIYQILEKEFEKKKRPIGYYDFVVNTNCFSRTIENMFHVSFLVRDGKVKISLNKENKPILEPIASKQLKEARSGGVNNGQIVSSFTISQWKNYDKPGILQKNLK